MYKILKIACRFIISYGILINVVKIVCVVKRRMEGTMKTGNTMKKIGAVSLAAVLAVSGITYTPVTTKAAEENTLVEEQGAATANTDVTYSFAVSDSNTVYVDLFVPEMVSGMVSFYQNGTYVDAITLTADSNSWMYVEAYGLYYHSRELTNPTPADWTVTLNFNTDTNYLFLVSQEKGSAVLNQNAVTITAGFTDKLSVSGATGTVTWESSNNSVASVDSSGKISAKKAGSAKVTATTENGQVLTCTVSVKKNEYAETRVYASSIQYGDATVQIYKMSYDKKGNLVLKTSVLNNSGKVITGMKKLKFTIKTSTGKKIGTYTLKNKKFSLSSGSSKDFTFTIKKSALNIKKADLRTATYSPSGTYTYRN